MGDKLKLLITNVVYGATYADIFLNCHLKSMLDPSNIPTFGPNTTYVIFTDAETEPILRKHPNMSKLLSICEVEMREFGWNPTVNKFDYRYNLLIETFKQSVKLAIERESLLSAMVADLVVAQHFLPKIMTKMDQGHDAVFTLPPRGAAETMRKALDQYTGAMPDFDLWRLLHNNLHPLFVAAHYNSPTFTKYPFYLLWNTGTGMLARSFSLTPIVFKPTEEMFASRYVIDIEIPGMFKNPYWCHDWDDAGVVGCEPLICYYPPGANFPASIPKLRKFAKDRHPSQRPFLKERLYYPNRLIANVPTPTLEISDLAVCEILDVQD